MADVSLRRIAKRFGDALVVDALDIDIRQGEFLTLLGPSGCGKTTTLRMIAGFVQPTGGRVFIGGEDVTDLEPRKRQIGMVFQDYALFPHLTIAENVAFGLVERRTPRARIAPRVTELLELIRLPDLGHRLPAELSGGQQQRVALARAIAHPPQVLLMDEPLGALDLKMREYMQVELRRIQQHLGLTVVYVTHDQIEAMAMSDRIAVMNGGRIEQLDRPEIIYNKPRTRFVANFVGKVNFIDGAIRRTDAGVGAIETKDGALVRAPVQQPVGSRVTLAIRPEHLTICRPTGAVVDGHNVLTGRIRAQTFCGNVRHYAVELDQQEDFLVETKPADAGWRVGDEVNIAWRPDDSVVVADSPLA
jgi:spermidine/putrescine ABC transporter ATP-binding subunit